MKAWALGVCSAVTASACCLGPAILALLGFGSLGLGSIMGRYHMWSLGIAVVFLALGWYRYINGRRRCRSRQCRMAQGRLTKWALIVSSVVVAIFTLGG